jgi:hypothetical protein
LQSIPQRRLIPRGYSEICDVRKAARRVTS